MPLSNSLFTMLHRFWVAFKADCVASRTRNFARARRFRQIHSAEQCECRTLLAAITVNSSLDNLTAGDGLVTLREAIIAANTNSMTDLGEQASGADTIVFDPILDGTPITLTITGAADDTSLSGDLDILSNITIQGNGALNTIINGGADINDLNNSPGIAESLLHVQSIGRLNVDGVTLTGGNSEYGGAIRNDGPEVTINHSTLSGNYSSYRGGAVYNDDGNVFIYDSIISNNVSEFEGGGVRNRVGYLDIVESKLFENHAYDGGAINAYSGVVIVRQSSEITNNSATRGGGIYGEDGQITIEHSLLSGNVSSEIGGGFGTIGTSHLMMNYATVSYNMSGNGGGGAYAGQITINNSIITKNEAHGSGGGIVGFGNITNSEISDNTGGRGGGVFLRGGNIADSRITNNHGTSGGGIFAYGAEVSGSTISGNTATNDGGGINNSNNNLLVTRSIIDNNESGRDGGGIFQNASTNNRLLSITFSKFSSNMATRNGGGILSDGGDLIVINSNVSGNTSSTNGGGIHSDNDELLIANSTISGNMSNIAGGGIAASVNDARITNSTVVNNIAANGGLIVSTGPLELNNSILSGNTTGPQFISYGTVTGTNNLISDGQNTAGLLNTITGNPELGPLQDNGGLTFTHALAMTSPAINAGINGLADDYFGDQLLTDQRGDGFNRIINGTIDLGAYEAPVTDLSVTISDSGDPIFSGQLTTYTVAVTNNGPVDISGVDLDSQLSFPTGTFLITGETLSFSGSGNGSLSNNADGPDISGMSLASGETATLTYVVVISSGFGTMTNMAVLSNGSVLDPQTDNDTALETTNILSPDIMRVSHVTSTLPADVDTSSQLFIEKISFTNIAGNLNYVSLTGPDANLFEIVGNQINLVAGASLDLANNPVLEFSVIYDDPTLGGGAESIVDRLIQLTDPNSNQLPSTGSSILGLSNGNWWLSQSDGENYRSTLAAETTFDTSEISDLFQGDFNGDGIEDLAVVLTNGKVFVGVTTVDNQLDFSLWTKLRTNGRKGLAVGDFNADGIDDLIGIFQNGDRARIWVYESDGTHFLPDFYRNYANYAGITNTLVGNFDGFAGDDLAILNTVGYWNVAQSDLAGTRFEYTRPWAKWDVTRTISDFNTLDVNGDAVDDILAVFENPVTAGAKTIFVGQSSGEKFMTRGWDKLISEDDYSDLLIGDFNGDNNDDIALLTNTFSLQVGLATPAETRFDRSSWGMLTIDGALQSIAVGSSNEDNLDDIFVRDSLNRWQSLESTGTAFVPRTLDQWNQTAPWQLDRVGSFTPGPTPMPPAEFNSLGASILESGLN